MLKKLIVLTVVFTVAVFAGPYVMPAPSGVEMLTAPAYQPLYEGGGTSYEGGSISASGYQGGVTKYDYQQNGAMGNRIMVDGDGDAHICWMHSATDGFTDRDIYYNVWEAASEDFIWADGVKASGTPKSGYTTMGLLSTGEAVVACHHQVGTANEYGSVVMIDAAPKVGSFTAPIRVAENIPEEPIWPHMVIDNDDVIHVTGHVWMSATPTPTNGDELYYSRSTDGGVSFSNWESLASDAGSDVAMAVSPSGKIAIAWVNAFPISGTDKRATHGNVTYRESTNNGQTWSSPVEVTDGFYGDEQPNSRDTITLGAITTSIDCCYDGNDNLFIGWGDAWRLGFVENDTNWYSYYYRWFHRMMCWTEGLAEPTIPSGDSSQFYAVNEEGDPIDYFNIGFWGIAAGITRYDRPGLGCWNPQLAASEDGGYVAYTWAGQWDSLDITGAGTINADIYGAKTFNGGNTWSNRANITNTHSPGAGIGASESEEYHSLYPWIASDSLLHITYIWDLFAGSVVNVPTEGIATNNPVMYWKGKPTGIEETPEARTSDVTLIGRNPVSNSVSFSVNASANASFKIYDAAGSLVATLIDGNLPGNRTLTWNTRNVASGVYFYSFVTPVSTANGRVVVVH